MKEWMLLVNNEGFDDYRFLVCMCAYARCVSN